MFDGIRLAWRRAGKRLLVQQRLATLDDKRVVALVTRSCAPLDLRVKAADEITTRCAVRSTDINLYLTVLHGWLQQPLEQPGLVEAVRRASSFADAIGMRTSGRNDSFRPI